MLLLGVGAGVTFPVVGAVAVAGIAEGASPPQPA